MTGAELEKLHTLTHYRDAAGQAQEERRAGGERRGPDDRRTAQPDAPYFDALLCIARMGCSDGSTQITMVNPVWITSKNHGMSGADPALPEPW